MGCSYQNQNSQAMNKNDINKLPSTITLKVNNENVSVPLTDYLVIKDNGNGTSSSTNPNDSAKKSNFKPPTFSTYSPNTEVKIVKNKPTIKGNYFDQQTNKQINIKITNNGFKLPKKQGKYVYRIHAIWHNYDATYTFLVNIK